MEFIEPILYLGISQTFFAALLIATKKPTNTGNRLMATLMFMLFFDLIFALIKIKLIVFYSFPFIAFTYGPILFFYVRFMTQPKRKFNFINLLHFIPFVVFFVVSVIFREDKMFTNLKDFFVNDRIISLRIVYSACFFASITIYSILTFIDISRHQKHLKDLVSFTSGVITLNWLKIISISFYVTYVLFFILGGLNIIVTFLPFDPYYTIFVFISIFSFIYSFYVIKQPLLVRAMAYDEEIEQVDESDTTKKSTKGYIKSGLRKEDAQKLLKRLVNYMEKEKPYLDRDLNIMTLSSLTDIPKHYITEILNEYHDRNFFTFINEYRVNEVIERFNDPINENYTILAIAYDSGFNSKSTFNSIFKSVTGLTPTQYRKSTPKI